MDRTITCTVCGHRFDPAHHSACGSCPLHDGCSTACCPHCGTTNINPAGSRLATFLVHLFGGTPHDPSSTIPAKRVSQ